MTQALPKLVRLYIRHTLIGFAVAAVFVAGLLWANVGNLWHLVTHAEGGYLAAFLLVVFNGIVFSGVQFGIAIMGMAEAEKPRGGGPKRPVGQMVPVRVGANDAFRKV